MSRRIDWRRCGLISLRMALGLAGWLLNQSGKLLQRTGTALLGWAEALRSK